MHPWKASSTHSKLSVFTIESTQPGWMPKETCLDASKASKTHIDCILHWAISAPQKWNEKQLNPVHSFGGKSNLLTQIMALVREFDQWDPSLGTMPRQEAASR
jgi:hypothetical protein